MKLALLLISSIAFGQSISFPGPGMPHAAGGGGTPVFISTSFNQYSSPTTTPAVTITNTGLPGGTPVTPAVGETLIIHLGGSQSGVVNVTSCTDNQLPANTYTVDNKRSHATITTGVALASTHVATAAGTFTITCTAANNSYFYLTVTRFSGMNTATVDGAPTGVDSTGNTVDCGTFTPTAGEAMVVVAAYSSSSPGSDAPVTSAGTPGTYTIPVNGSSTTGGTSTATAVEYQIIASTSGAYTPKFAITTTYVSSCVAVGYKVGP